jgi:hypothetical protein
VYKKLGHTEGGVGVGVAEADALPDDVAELDCDGASEDSGADGGPEDSAADDVPEDDALEDVTADAEAETLLDAAELDVLSVDEEVLAVEEAEGLSEDGPSDGVVT